MVRMMAWTGSAWKDAKVWTGSQWKSYTPDVYGAVAYAYDMNSGANGWVQEYGAGGETPALNWANVHLYGNDFPNNAYGTAMQLRAKPGTVMKLRPGDTVHVQASLLVQHISGAVGEGGTFRAGCTFGDGLYATEVAGAIELGVGWFGWATVDTRSHGTGYTVPANGGNPYEMPPLNEMEVSCYIRGPALGGAGTYRFFCDWYQLIDQNGNLLYRHTANAIHVVRAWNGSAWV